MIGIPRAAILGLVAMLSVGSARAADEPDELMPGRIVFIRTGLLAKFVARATTSFDLPDANNAPTAEGASLAVFDTGGPAADTYPLPSGGWKGLGNPAGSKGYKYKGLGSISDPCRVVLVKSNIVKAVCKGAGISMATPFTGDVGIRLAVGTTFILVAASEFVGARNGLGWFIWSSWQTLQVERMYVGIIAISLLGYLTLQLIHHVEARMVPWAHRR